MSIKRRQFLLSTAGAAVGAIVPSFYFRALEFFEQFGEPLIEPPEHPVDKLFVSNFNGYPELSLGNPYQEPPKMTFREYFERYEPDKFETFEEDWLCGPEGLDRPMDERYLWVMWMMHFGPSARAYHYLKSLDLGDALTGPHAEGGLKFFEDSGMTDVWKVVSPENAVTLSLLQQRLNDLGTGISVVGNNQALYWER